MPKRVAANPKPKAAAKVKKTAAGYKFPEKIPSGYVITDTKKQNWILHESIGTGGFGEIYSASDADKSSKTQSVHPFAVKVEPKENGPLYVEMQFYVRVAKGSDIEEWKKSHGLKKFGMPVLHGSGSFEYNNSMYRFIVTDRLGRNLQDILTENGKKFSHVTVLQIGIQVLNVLKYIHSKGYIHGDIKAANMMLGAQRATENTVFVIDFGLAAKCAVSAEEFNNDPKKANNGTIEYISRDGHKGVFGFRGDLEILGYNLIHWYVGSLPWETNLKDIDAVEKMKIEMMKNPSSYAKKNIPGLPEELINFMQYIASLKNNDVPNYDFCYNLLMIKLEEFKCKSAYEKLEFSNSSSNETSSSKKKTTSKAKTTKKKKLSLIDIPGDENSNVLVKKRKSPIKNAAEREVVNKKLAKGKKLGAACLPSTSYEDNDKKNDEADFDENCLDEIPLNKVVFKRSRRSNLFTNEVKEALLKTKAKKKIQKHVGFEKSNTLSEENGSEEIECNEEYENEVDDKEPKDSLVKVKKLNKKSNRKSSGTFTIKIKSGSFKSNSRKKKDSIAASKNRKNSFSRQNNGETDCESSVENDKDKLNWKDAPTVVASNVKKAGEYTKKGAKKRNK